MTTELAVQPVFVIGVPRSGTSAFFDAFIRHQRFGFQTRYASVFPQLPWIDILTQIFDNRFYSCMGEKNQYGDRKFINKVLPRTVEDYAFWDRETKVNFSRGYLLNQKADPKIGENVRRAIGARLAYQGKERFSAKLTGPPRITYLHSIYPNAKFVHVIRDGRAVVHSLMNVVWWQNDGGLSEPWWTGGFPETYTQAWQSQGRDPQVLAALQWKNIIEVAHAERSSLGKDQYVEVHYEDFVARPHELLSSVYAFCGVEDSERAHAFLSRRRPVQSMNLKYKDDWSDEMVSRVTMALQPTLAELGYQ